jgi:beta-lactamase superfamily II metal-dependent hydrolase
MYEVDFLPVEKTGELGSKSGDAIAVHFTEQSTQRGRVVVIDGGYGHTAEAVVAHIKKWYGTSHIDLMISTHPDQDHINGLAGIMQIAAEGNASVGELLIHRPHDHADSALEMSNIEVVDALISLAEDLNVTISEPFTGLSRFGDQVLVLGPTQTYYEALLERHLEEEHSGTAALRRSASKSFAASIIAKAGDLLERKLPNWPIETLGEDGDSGPRNDTSAVTLIRVDGQRMLFTGDAGITALNQVWDEYERVIGSFPDTPLDFFQAPHHGSRRNLSPSLLNRIFGEPGENPLAPTSMISSALNDKKHPSPKVTNALGKRGVEVFATESRHIAHTSDTRPGWSALSPIGPLEEDD